MILIAYLHPSGYVFASVCWLEPLMSACIVSCGRGLHSLSAFWFIIIGGVYVTFVIVITFLDLSAFHLIYYGR